VTGLDGITYSVVVTAESVYEAIALGMTEIRNSPWTGNIAEGLNTVTVQILEVTTEHTVRFMDFEKWVNQEPAGYPGEMIQTQASQGNSRIKESGEAKLTIRTSANPRTKLIGG
jgi:hypothetical protein